VVKLVEICCVFRTKTCMKSLKIPLVLKHSGNSLKFGHDSFSNGRTSTSPHRSLPPHHPSARGEQGFDPPVMAPRLIKAYFLLDEKFGSVSKDHRKKQSTMIFLAVEKAC
jgi:hypothetical protein